MTSIIIEFGIHIRQGQDICVWKHEVDGKFTTKLACELIRLRGEICPWKKWLWQNGVPKKMSFFLWCAKRKAISVDDII